jgi:hypothetical protein
MRPTERPVVLYKRWRLRHGVSHQQVVDLVVNRVAPHYRKLSVDVELALEATDPTTVLAIQRWPTREALEEAMSGGRFEAWWREYQPILAAWDAMVVFDEEWESDVLVG